MDHRGIDEDRLWSQVANLSTAVAEDQPGEAGAGSGDSGMTFKNPHLQSQWDETLKILAGFTRQQIAEIYSLKYEKEEGGRDEPPSREGSDGRG